MDTIEVLTRNRAGDTETLAFTIDELIPYIKEATGQDIDRVKVGATIVKLVKKGKLFRHSWKNGKRVYANYVTSAPKIKEQHSAIMTGSITTQIIEIEKKARAYDLIVEKIKELNRLVGV